jgi:hypothetical protein
VAAPARPSTHLQHGIHKPKTYTGGTTWYRLFTATREPWNLPEALSDSQWKAAMDNKIDTLHRNKTWHLVPRTPGRNVIDSKWVYKIKWKVDGSIDRYKARLVAKGFKQWYNIDYEDTFSLVVKATTIRIILSIVVSNGWSLWQLDVHNTFLHGVLEEEVFMRQPLGYVNSDSPNLVCQLDKALYGLKQVPRARYSKLTSSCNCWVSLLQKLIHLFFYSTIHLTIFVLVYVDDIIVVSSSSSATTSLLRDLEKDFAIKDLGPLHFFMGIEVTPIHDGILLSQGKYAAELLHKAGMVACKSVPTPLFTSKKLSAHSGDVLGPQDATHYRSIVGVL